MRQKLLLGFLFFISSFVIHGQIPYGVYEVPFHPLSPDQATNIQLLDDMYSAPIPIGFNFRYFGTDYSSLNIASNGYVTFNPELEGAYSNFSVSTHIPDTTAPLNSIFFTWCDINPMNAGNISYGIIGDAPNRIFVVQFIQVPLFACTQTYTGQLQLFEGSNNIEVHITSKLFCDTQGGLSSIAIEGIQNATGTEAYAVPGRNNYGVWQASNDAWRFDPDTVSQPVCIMSGRVIADFNGNCILDESDFSIPGQVLIRDNGEAYTSTTGQGVYSFEADTGNYTIAFNGLQSGLPFAEISCPTDASYNVSFETAGSVSNMLDFYVHPDSSCSDIRVSVVPMGPMLRCAGNTNHQYVSVSNHGLLPIIGYTVSLTLPDSMSVMETIPAFSSQAGNTLTWNFTDTLVYGEYTQISISDSLSCYATDGTLKCLSATVQSDSDCNTGNNSSEVCQIVNGSFDPNHIQLLEMSSPAEFVNELLVAGNETWYTYRIEFQNTGTGPAQTVVITDVLPAFFDYGTAEILATSHSAFLVNLGNGTLKFVYNGISLPDSNTNYAGSIGSVVFRVKANQMLFPGQQVANQASIVFDVNEPVITNQALIRVPNVTGISSIENSVSMYPNPANQSIRIKSSNQLVDRVSILDLSGKQVGNYPISKAEETLVIDQLANGIYLVEFYQNQRKITQKKLIVSHQ